MSLLMTGVSGQLAQLVARRLADAGRELVGIDVRPLPKGYEFPGHFQQMRRYNQRQVAEVFRHHRPTHFVHLGVRADFTLPADSRYTQNVLGTRHLLELCEQHGVRRVVALSTYHVYGAHQHNPVHIREDAPLRAIQTFPELVDVVELDHAVTSFLWRHRKIRTLVLRPANIVGRTLNNTMSRLLRSARCPMLVGFDPMMQYLHAEDVAQAIGLAISSRKSGVYNLAGEGAIAYSEAIRISGGGALPLPHLLAYPAVSLLSQLRLVFPPHLMDFFRYPVIIDDRAFRNDFDYTPQHTTVQTLRGLRSAPAMV